MHIQDKEISYYLDNTLTAEKRLKMQQHFLCCEKCNQKRKEWENLYTAMDNLESDFQLDGLEEKILLKIKAQKLKTEEKEAFPMLSTFKLVSIPALLVITMLLLTPLTQMMQWGYQHLSSFMLGESLDFINEVKWQAVDVIAIIQSMGLTEILLSVMAVILIVGGAYVSLKKRTPGEGMNTKPERT